MRVERDDGRLLQVYHRWEERCASDKKPIAAFDLDHTLIVPRSGAVFRKNAQDWRFMYEAVPKALAAQAKTHLIVIFTNQAGLIVDDRMDEFLDFLTDFLSHISCPVLVFASLTYDIHRKPAPGMFWKLRDQLLYDPLELSESFFVGDSAGRKHDFSAADCKFAHNLKLSFRLPEVYFGTASGPLKLPAFDYDPTCILERYIVGQEPPRLEKNTIYVTVGLPKIGKSRYLRTHYGEDERVVMLSNLQDLDSVDVKHRVVIVDVDCHTLLKRAMVLGTAKRLKTSAVALYFEIADLYDWLHLNTLFHHANNAPTKSDKDREKLFNSFSKPTPREGFKEVIRIGKFITSPDTLEPLNGLFLI